MTTAGGPLPEPPPPVSEIERPSDEPPQGVASGAGNPEAPLESAYTDDDDDAAGPF